MRVYSKVSGLAAWSEDCTRCSCIAVLLVSLVSFDATTLCVVGTTVTSRNCSQEQIKIRINSRNVYYHSVKNLLSSRLVSKHLRLKYTKIKFYLLFCMGVKLRLSH